MKSTGRDAGLTPFEILLSAIEAGELQPGERLQETRLAEQFGLSRTPIREALHRLETLGLAEPGPQRGLIIAHISYERLRQLFDVREGLERLAMDLAVSAASDAEIALLQEMINKEALDKMKDGVVLLNFARDLLVDEDALIEALDSGKVKKYVTDFANHTVAGHKGILVTPHLVAST